MIIILFPVSFLFRQVATCFKREILQSTHPKSSMSKCMPLVPSKVQRCAQGCQLRRCRAEQEVRGGPWQMRAAVFVAAPTPVRSKNPKKRSLIWTKTHHIMRVRNLWPSCPLFLTSPRHTLQPDPATPNQSQAALFGAFCFKGPLFGPCLCCAFSLRGLFLSGLLEEVAAQEQHNNSHNLPIPDSPPWPDLTFGGFHRFSRLRGPGAPAPATSPTAPPAAAHEGPARKPQRPKLCPQIRWP